MSLIEELQANDKKGIFTSDDNFINYSTGILPLDYANGFWQTVRIGDEEKTIPAIGIEGGSITGIISETGGGKSTLAIQIGYSIIRPFENGLLDIIDAEKTNNRERIVQITGCQYDDPRIKLSKRHTTIEDVMEKFNRVCDIKEAGGNKYKYEIKGRSYDGKPFMVYEPSVFIIDSLPSFNSKDYNTDDLGTNVDQMRAAKDITRFFTNILDKAWKYNVSFIIINHIKPKTDINPYSAPPRGMLMLGQQETLPRGTAAQYFTKTYMRIRTRKSDAYTIADNGFTGRKCTIELAKSKTNEVGVSFPVAFISDLGFDPVYTLYEFANSIGIIQGRNPYLYFVGMEDMKFNRKDFRDKFISDQEFSNKVLKVLKPAFEAMVGATISTEAPKMEYGTLNLDEV